MELLENRLVIEADLQAFLAASREAVVELGGGELESAPVLVDLSRRLRRAGAGRGHPVAASLVARDHSLVAEWDDSGTAGVMVLRRFLQAPMREVTERLRRRLATEYQVQDPEALLHRNREMVSRFESNRARMGRELEALQQALERRQRELQESIREAETDPLTKIFNRRAFDERIATAFQRTVRQGTEGLSLLLVDLDHFKEVNDTHGHGYGDDYLCRTAEALVSVIRKDVDAAFRIGGDEFAVLLFAEGSTACGKALGIVEAMGGKVSIGVASIAPGQQHAGTLEGFIQEADRALYEAKLKGRGRVVRRTCRKRPEPGCTGPCSSVAAAVDGSVA